MGFELKGFDESAAKEIASAIDRDGYAVLANVISDEMLSAMRHKAEATMERNGGEYALFVGADELAETVLAEIPASALFQRLCAKLYQHAVRRPSPEDGFYQVFRCLKGASGRAHSAHFHFDSYVVTALLPISLPRAGPAGDLIMFPNTRRVRRSYLNHLGDKITFENPLAQIALRRAASHRKLGARAIGLVPGNLYLFWGYRSLHANEACDPNELRATALFHYGNPHADSPARAAIRAARRWPARAALEARVPAPAVTPAR